MKYETAKYIVIIMGGITLLLTLYSAITLWLEDRGKNKKDADKKN
jgi:hypothetical protein